MRHIIASKQLNRDTKHRESLQKNLVRELVEHGSITTTVAKAKVIKPIVDKVVTMAKKGGVSAHRNLHKIFGKRDVVNTLMERVVPAVGTRTSGFTRITPVGSRAGDNSTMVQIAWVDAIEKVGDLLSLTPRRQSEKPKAEKKAAVKKETKSSPVVAEQAEAKKTVKAPAKKSATKKAEK